MEGFAAIFNSLNDGLFVFEMNMRISPLLASLVIGTGVTASLFAQAPPKPPAAPAAPPKNLVGNGGFESSSRRESLWDGTDNNGYLTGEPGAVPVLTTKGDINDTAMPLSVSVADMNNDKLLDIVSMDVLGYLRIFFNSGTPQEPKFTIGELGGIFLTRTDEKDPILGGSEKAADHARMAPRISATDMLKSGKKDLIIGNYLGEILLVPNVGSAQSPDFKQPANLSAVTIPTMKDSNQRWGNVFAPATWDWNKDGKDDLLLGEGSYSANNIHLLLNMGAGARPDFDENNRFVLAYGDGLEQLTPTVVDYNGDGLPDLLVAERTGKIAVYLNKGGQPKAGDPPSELPFASFMSGGVSPLGFSGISTVSTGDLNGDGLFDLVVGKTNGRIALVLNTGSKTEPKFGAAGELKGDAGTPVLSVPTGWDVDYGLKRGNFYAYLTVVKEADDKNAQPVEGLGCLKAGYFPSGNKVMPAPTDFTPAFPDFSLNTPSFLSGGTSERVLAAAPARYFMLRQLGRFRLKTNTNYTLSFKVKGLANDCAVLMGWTGFKKLSDAKITRGADRGAVTVQKNDILEAQRDSMRFSPGPQWAEVKQSFRVALKNKDLQDLTEATTSLLQVSFSVPPGGEVYFDDFTLVETP